MYAPFLLWTCMCTYTHLLFFSPTCICTFIKVNLRISLSWLVVLRSVLWLSFHQGKPLYHTSEWVSIKDHTCIIMPKISPFGLDGNHHTKSLSPLWHQGQRADQEILSLCCPYSPWVPTKISYWAPPFVYAKMYQSIHAPPENMHVCKIKTWLYTSISQPSGDTPFLDSSTQPSGDIPNVYTWLNNKNHYIIHPMHSGGNKIHHMNTKGPRT